MPTCTHCYTEFSSPTVKLHEKRCKENPKNKPKPKKKQPAKKTTNKTKEAK